MLEQDWCKSWWLRIVVEVHIKLLQRRQHLEHFIPRIRWCQAQLCQQVDTVEQHRESLCFRQGVVANVAILIRITERNEGTGPEPFGYFFVVGELVQVHNTVTNSKLNRQLVVASQRYVGCIPR